MHFIIFEQSWLQILDTYSESLCMEVSNSDHLNFALICIGFDALSFAFRVLFAFKRYLAIDKKAQLGGGLQKGRPGGT
jgi:hypothetical protein